MAVFQTRLFFRIISKNKEIYLLKIISLSTAFSCSILIILFSLNEFGYDRFHQDYHSVFRILQRNNTESYSGNRLSNKIPFDVYSTLKSRSADSITISRVKVMNDVSVLTGKRTFHNLSLYATDPEITDIFTFDILDGSLKEFRDSERTAIIASSTALNYFGTRQAAGKEIKIYTGGDTLVFSIAAVYADYPQNSHEAFNTFIRFDSASIQSLNFNPKDAGIYGKALYGNLPENSMMIDKFLRAGELSYKFQPISEIYFGPRVMGEEARHGDHYSIVILICISALILFLALTSFINLTTLTLPYRSKELAIKKLAGTSDVNLVLAFAKESFSVVSISLIFGVLILTVASNWIKPILAIDLPSLLSTGDFLWVLILIGLFVIIGAAPLFMTLKFARATPNRLLSTVTITFPRFKRTITFLQLGISIFLIVASMVIRRQINFSLLKEPGRSHDQVVYINYPKDLTNEGLANLRLTWKRVNANVVDVMATSHLPDRINSKELHSAFYLMSVDRGFKDFFDLKMVEGSWFRANDGDSIVVMNEQGKKILQASGKNAVGVFADMSGQFNQPERPLKLNVAAYFNYNFLCVRVLEVDIRRTIRFLSTQFEEGASVSFLNKHFEEWLSYQDKLNKLSEFLAIISGILSCCAIYGLSISVVRDKLKQIAIHKLCGANTIHLTRLLVREFSNQMLMAILIFGPLTYIILKELLRTFAYSTHFTWMDPLLPFGYCALVITLLCGFQVLSLNREDLTSSLKG